jgi:far upstream element-binding protein
MIAARNNDPRLSDRGFRRSRSRSPQRQREAYRDNYNPYRDERRNDSYRGGGGPGFARDRSFSPGVGRPGGASPYDSRGGGGGDSGVESITIDSNLVGLIIGRQGENLRRVEAQTSTRVQFITGPEATGPKRECKITGTYKAREDAKAEIARIIEENGNPARGNVPPERMAGGRAASGNAPMKDGESATQIMVPNRTVGLIIGRGGETIRDLQERSGCHVNIVSEDKSVNGLRPVNLIGNAQATAMAKDLIMEIVDSDTKTQAAQGGGQRDSGRGGGNQSYGGGVGDGKISETMKVPSEAVGMIIGKGRQHLLLTLGILLSLTYRWRDHQTDAGRHWMQDQCLSTLRCRL